MQSFFDILGIVLSGGIYFILITFIFLMIAAAVLSFEGTSNVVIDILKLFDPRKLFEFLKKLSRKAKVQLFVQLIALVLCIVLCALSGQSSIIPYALLVLLFAILSARFLTIVLTRFDKSFWPVLLLVPLCTFCFLDAYLFVCNGNEVLSNLVSAVFLLTNIVSILRIWLLAIQLLGTELYHHKKTNLQIETSVEAMITLITYIIVQISVYASTMFALIKTIRNGFKHFSVTFANCYYYVIITFTSVGYGEIVPITLEAKILTCCIALGGYMTSACVIGNIVGALLKPHANEKSSDGELHMNTGKEVRRHEKDTSAGQ